MLCSPVEAASTVHPHMFCFSFSLLLSTFPPCLLPAILLRISKCTQVFVSYLVFVKPKQGHLPKGQTLLCDLKHYGSFTMTFAAFACLTGSASGCPLAQAGRVFGELCIGCPFPPSVASIHSLQPVLELLSCLNSHTTFLVLP